MGLIFCRIRSRIRSRPAARVVGRDGRRRRAIDDERALRTRDDFEAKRSAVTRVAFGTCVVADRRHARSSEVSSEIAVSFSSEDPSDPSSEGSSPRLPRPRPSRDGPRVSRVYETRKTRKFRVVRVYFLLLSATSSAAFVLVRAAHAPEHRDPPVARADGQGARVPVARHARQPPRRRVSRRRVSGGNRRVNSLARAARSWRRTRGRTCARRRSGLCRSPPRARPRAPTPGPPR